MKVFLIAIFVVVVGGLILILSTRNKPVENRYYLKDCYGDPKEAYTAFTALIRTVPWGLHTVIEDGKEIFVKQRLAGYRETNFEFIPKDKGGYFGYHERGELKLYASSLEDVETGQIDTVWVVIKDHYRKGCYQVEALIENIDDEIP